MNFSFSEDQAVIRRVDKARQRLKEARVLVGLLAPQLYGVIQAGIGVLA